MQKSWKMFVIGLSILSSGSFASATLECKGLCTYDQEIVIGSTFTFAKEARSCRGLERIENFNCGMKEDYFVTLQCKPPYDPTAYGAGVELTGQCRRINPGYVLFEQKVNSETEAQTLLQQKADDIAKTLNVRPRCNPVQCRSY